MVSVQIVRGIAALLVVLFHIFNKAVAEGIIGTNIFSVGESGVDLFFIISGFIMAFITNNKKISAPEFIFDRVFRIFPLYWIVTTVALMAYFLYPTAIKWGGDLDISILDSYSLIPSDSAILVAVGWTLRYELLFYALFALCIPLKEKKLVSCSVILASLALLSIYFNNGKYETFIFNPMLMEFIMGIFSFHIYNSKINMSMALPIGLISLIVFGTTFPANEWQRLLCMGLPMMLIFIGFISLENKIKSQKSFFAMALKIIGDSSYSLYLTHFFTIGAVSRVMKIISPHGSLMLLAFFGLVSSVIVGLACNTLIERNISMKKLLKFRYQ